MSKGQQEIKLVLEDLTGAIRQTAFEAHRYYGSGFLEKVYENSLVNRLRKKGFEVQQQEDLTVRDEDGTIVGLYCADLIVNRSVIVEVKAVSEISSKHSAQVINYLKATGFKVGLVVNFGGQKLKCKRFVL